MGCTIMSEVKSAIVSLLAIAVASIFLHGCESKSGCRPGNEAKETLLGRI